MDLMTNGTASLVAQTRHPGRDLAPSAWRLAPSASARSARVGQVAEIRGFYGQPLVISLSAISAALSGYHGYKRDDSAFWAAVWALLGWTFPVITPVVALAQGFARPAAETR